MAENGLSIFQCGFCKKYSTQHALITVTDKSKGFGCIAHDLLIAKLHASKFDVKAPNLIFYYLTESKQRVKINSSFSSCLDLFQAVQQGSILGLL